MKLSKIKDYLGIKLFKTKSKKPVEKAVEKISENAVKETEKVYPSSSMYSDFHILHNTDPFSPHYSDVLARYIG